MEIIMTKDYKKITFNWNKELTEFNYICLNVIDDEFDNILSLKGHEGVFVEGWETEIK